MKQDLEFKINQALKLFKKSKFIDALKTFNELNKNNNHFILHWYLAHTHFRLKNFKKAFFHVKKSIDLKSKDLINLSFLAEILVSLRKSEEAISILNEILELDEHNENALFGLSKIYLDLGDKNKSQEYLEQLCEKNNENYSYLYQLVRLDETKLKKKIINKIEKKINNFSLDKNNLIYANLILARYYEKKDIVLELNHLIKAHNYYFNQKIVAAKQEFNFYNNLIPKFMSKIRQSSYESQNGFKPIFIMGLPRTGTTLVENLIYKSQKVKLGDETQVFTNTFFGNGLFESLNSPDSKINFDYASLSFQNLHDIIIKRYQQYDLCNGTKAFTDKSLENIFYIDFIKKIFPNAKFIYCKRDPLANLIGILKVFLPDLIWSHSLDQIYKMFCLHDKLVKNNKENLFIINLENLSTHPKEISQELYDYLDLPWGENVLDKNSKNNLEIRSASNIQVRSEITKHDLSQTNKYYDLILSKGFNIDKFYN